jgi:acetyl-CoA carboxylase biotin carboxyl carrier protein
METKEIQKLIDFISHSGLDEVSIETSDLKISVKRYGAAATTVAAPVPVAIAAAPKPAETAAPAVASAPTKAANDESKYLAIKSPMIGTFYRAAGEGKAPFVEIGSEISAGSTACIIEAMKLFNEIESEVSGKIVKVMVENATPVEYDQVLFLVDPS